MFKNDNICVYDQYYFLKNGFHRISPQSKHLVVHEKVEQDTPNIMEMDLELDMDVGATILYQEIINQPFNELLPQPILDSDTKMELDSDTKMELDSVPVINYFLLDQPMQSNVKTKRKINNCEPINCKRRKI